MRILVISNLFPPDHMGGYELGCRQAADGLRAAGHEVVVLTSVPRCKETLHSSHVIRRLRLVDIYDEYYHSKARLVINTLRNQEALLINSFNIHVLGQVVEQFRPDVVYVWNVIGLGGLGLLAALQHMGLPWVMHIMDHVPQSLCSLEYGGRTIPSIAEAFIQRCRGWFICCSQTTLDETVRAGVSIANRTVILPNWVTTSGSSDRVGYMTDGYLRMVTAGSLSHSKGTDIVVKAARILKDRRHSNFTIDMYGACSEPRFQSLVQALDLTEHIHICGIRTQIELNQLFSDYDLFVFPTWGREPMAFAPMEAMAHGCVSVISRVCGNAEWLIEGLDCLKSDRNPLALADVIESVLIDSTPLAEIGRRGARTVLRYFLLSTILPKIESVLDNAIRTNCSPRRTASEAFRLALLAEKSFQCLVHERIAS